MDRFSNRETLITLGEDGPYAKLTTLFDNSEAVRYVVANARSSTQNYPGLRHPKRKISSEVSVKIGIRI